jgi:hypothetical protein
LHYRALSCVNPHLAVAGRGDPGRDVGHRDAAGSGPVDAAGCLDDHVGGGLGGPVGGFGQDAGVGVGGGDDAGMAQHLLDDLQVGAGCQGDGGGAVAQVVEPNRRQVQPLDQHVEPVGEVLGPDRAPVGVGEQRPSLPPARPGAGAGVAAALLGELVPQQLDRLPDGLIDQPAGAGLVQGDRPAAGAALRRRLVLVPGFTARLAFLFGPGVLVAVRRSLRLAFSSACEASSDFMASRLQMVEPLPNPPLPQSIVESTLTIIPSGPRFHEFARVSRKVSETSLPITSAPAGKSFVISFFSVSFGGSISHLK